MKQHETKESASAQQNPVSKESLELRKLQLEIEEMERPFWKRPTYILAGLPTLLIVVTLIVGFLNGFLRSHVASLIAENKRLQTKYTDLNAQLADINLKITEAEKKLKEDEKSLEGQQQALDQLPAAVSGSPKKK